MQLVINRRILFTSFILFLLCSGCSIRNKDSEIANDKLNYQMSYNSKKWDESVKKGLEVSAFPNKYDPKEIIFLHNNFSLETVDGLKSISLTHSDLFKSRETVIEGKVINLQPMKDKLSPTTTKATILINKTLSGKNITPGNQIYTEFGGGIDTANSAFSDAEGNYIGGPNLPKNPESKVFVKNPAFPLPTIGDKIVTKIHSYNPVNENQMKLYKNKYGLERKNFYIIKDPYIFFWIKRNNKYELNNPFLHAKIFSEYLTYLTDITNDINQRVK